MIYLRFLHWTFRLVNTLVSLCLVGLLSLSLTHHSFHSFSWVDIWGSHTARYQKLYLLISEYCYSLLFFKQSYYYFCWGTRYINKSNLHWTANKMGYPLVIHIRFYNIFDLSMLIHYGEGYTCTLHCKKSVPH